MHDIIDNRSSKLVDEINRILSRTQSARFAVGYFFLSGLESIAKGLEHVPEVRLLIGNTTNRETVEQMAEGYRRLDLVARAAEAQTFRRRTAAEEAAKKTAENLRSSMEVMDQTDQGQTLVRLLVHMIQEGRLKVRVFTKGRLHAKAYIFDYSTVYDEAGRALPKDSQGVAVVGSSNLTLAGLTHNTELNVKVHGDANHAQLVQWFEDLWKESEDFDEILMGELKESWALVMARPYDVYMKTLYTLVQDRLDGGEDRELLWDDEIFRHLTGFQLTAVRQAVRMIRDYGGAFVSDVVGLGKSFIGAAILKRFEKSEHTRALIICPASLVDLWKRYNELFQLNAAVLSMGFLSQDDGIRKYLDLKDGMYRQRNLILVDESHNFREPDSVRYRSLQAFLSAGRRCCFLTATPRNKSAWDIFHQIKLFHQDDKTILPIDPPNLREFFERLETEPNKIRSLLVKILVRRTRSHILRWNGYDAETHRPVDPNQFEDYKLGRRRAYIRVGDRHQFFPKRQLETVEYSIEESYPGLYDYFRKCLCTPRKRARLEVAPDELSYARYGLWHYVRPAKQHGEPYAGLQRAGANLRGLMRILLFKRLESSVFAFRRSLEKLLHVHEAFLAALREGIVAAGTEAQDLLYDSDPDEQEALLDQLKKVSGRYSAADFDVERLETHIRHDIDVLKKALSKINRVSPSQDAKLQTLLQRLEKPPLKGNKVLIFTQYADTARYLFENVNPGDKLADVEVIFGNDKSKLRVVGRFAPKANPEYIRPAGESEIRVLIATDVLSEGLNLQDADNIVNYDLHWNPVRLIQRFGRIDRIGSEHLVINAFNFLPERGIEKQLDLRQTLRNRIQEIQDTIGEDSAILDKSELVNPEAMYAIYEQRGDVLTGYEEDDGLLDLYEAEEMLRKLRQEDPAEFNRIAAVRDGIRSSKAKTPQSLYVFCQAGTYQQLFLVNVRGEILSRDVGQVLARIRCGPDLAPEQLSADYNEAVMRVKRLFVEEVKNRQAEQTLALSLSRAQQYALRELRLHFSQMDGEDQKAKLNVLAKAFAGPIPSAAKKELNVLRRNGLAGQGLAEELQRIYNDHHLQEWQEQRESLPEEPEVPRIICSEALD